MAEVVLDANPTLSSLPAELLAHIMRECDETSAASSAFTSHAHGLSIAARLWCATNAAQAASALGLAWAAQLPLAADMLATDVTLLPPATVMRFLSLSALERDLQSDLLWIPDEEARYTIAAAWLRAAPRPHRSGGGRPSPRPPRVLDAVRMRACALGRPGDTRTPSHLEAAPA